MASHCSSTQLHHMSVCCRVSRHQERRRNIVRSKKNAATRCVQAPGLAVVLVGSRKDSETYVRSKKKACDEVGITSFGADLPEDVSQAELLKAVADYNSNDDVNGILVQLPLPKHIDETAVLDAIDVEKDVDGFHPQNIGRLAMRGREPGAVSCTPKGCMMLLERSGVQISVRIRHSWQDFYTGAANARPHVLHKQPVICKVIHRPSCRI
jgi:5,10-methylene-tetrahydrofolate dehydrogenase/methenyl tetrahydrofolate cyclohydrolase